MSAEEEEAAEVEETPAEAVEAPSTGKSAGANETAEEVAPPPEEKTVSLDEYLANKEGMTLDLSSLRIGVRKDAVKVEAAVEEEAVEGEEEEYYEEGVEGEEYEEYYEEEEEAKVVELDGVRSPPAYPCLATIHQRPAATWTHEAVALRATSARGPTTPCNARSPRRTAHAREGSLRERLRATHRRDPGARAHAPWLTARCGVAGAGVAEPSRAPHRGAR